MFIDYFNLSKDHLIRIGWNPSLIYGRQVTQDDIDEVNLRTDLIMPAELQQFYLELGDAFAFIPDDSPHSDSGWQPITLADHAIHNSGFSEQIEEEALDEINSNSPRVDPQRIREEANRRKKWIPFYGFTGGGDLLCLDSEGQVRFYEALYWRSHAETWSFVLASSFSSFLNNWSQFCFTKPGCEWSSFCVGRTGQFDWSASHFPAVADRLG